MTQSLEQFREQVLQDPALSDQFKSVASPDAFANLAVQLGQQLGYSFTADEVKAAIAQHSPSVSAEISDEQLESIAGGGYTDVAGSCGCGSQHCTQGAACH